MLGWLKKHHVECPRCRSLRVSVPWEAARRSSARTLAFRLIALWLSWFLWLWLGLSIERMALWLGPLLLYLLVSLLLLRAITAAVRTCHCLDCGQRWSA